MAYSLKISLGTVVCRDRESLSEYDSFALAGAVIVDGEVTTFSRETIAMNERIRGTYAEPVIFDGTCDDRTIGLVLRGYDVDDNEKWWKYREQVQRASDALAGVAAATGAGAKAAFVLRHWPKVVDVIVKLDKNDLLVDHAGAVTLAEVSAVTFQRSHQRIDVRGVGRDVTGYSDWDYTVPVLFTYQNLDVPSFGEPAKQTLEPFVGSRKEDWLGTWDGEGVTCSITESSVAPWLLDVVVKERGRETTSEAVPISSVRLESIVVEQGTLNPLLERTEAAHEESAPFTRVVIGSRGASGRSWMEKILDVVPGEAPTGDRTPGSDRMDQVVTSVDWRFGSGRKHDEAVKVPQRERNGADLLELSGDAALEMHRIFLDGKRTRGRRLRYIRPFSVASILVHGSVDVMLDARVDL